MKKLFLVFSILMAFNCAQAAETNYPDADSAAQALFNPLRGGSSGISKSVSALPGETATGNTLIAQAKATNPVRPLQSSLSTILAGGGRLVSYTKTGEQQSLGGKVVKQTYNLFFTFGPTKVANLTIMQPTMTGGYLIMDAQFSNAPTQNGNTSNTIGN